MGEEQQVVFQRVKNVLGLSLTMISPVKRSPLTLYLTSTSKPIVHVISTKGQRDRAPCLLLEQINQGSQDEVSLDRTSSSRAYECNTKTLPLLPCSLTQLSDQVKPSEVSLIKTRLVRNCSMASSLTSLISQLSLQGNMNPSLIRSVGPIFLCQAQTIAWRPILREDMIGGDQRMTTCFYGSSAHQSGGGGGGGEGVVLYNADGTSVSLSSRLEFSCFINVAKYEALLVGFVSPLL